MVPPFPLSHFPPRRIAVLRRCGLLLQTEKRGLSFCLSITVVNPAKTAEPIEMPFGELTRVDPRNNKVDGGSDLLRRMDNFDEGGAAYCKA